MTVNQFLTNLKQFYGHDGHVAVNRTDGRFGITVYWKLFAWPPPNIFWLMVDNINQMATVVVVFRWWGREWYHFNA